MTDAERDVIMLRLDLLEMKERFEGMQASRDYWRGKYEELSAKNLPLRIERRGVWTRLMAFLLRMMGRESRS